MTLTSGRPSCQAVASFPVKPRLPLRTSRRGRARGNESTRRTARSRAAPNCAACQRRHEAAAPADVGRPAQVDLVGRGASTKSASPCRGRAVTTPRATARFMSGAPAPGWRPAGSIHSNSKSRAANGRPPGFARANHLSDERVGTALHDQRVRIWSPRPPRRRCAASPALSSATRPLVWAALPRGTAKPAARESVRLSANIEGASAKPGPGAARYPHPWTRAHTRPHIKPTAPPSAHVVRVRPSK